MCSTPEGDIVSVPVQHRLRSLPKLQEGRTGICLNAIRRAPALVRLRRHGRRGRRASEYVMVPYADFKPLESSPDKSEGDAKIKDLTLLATSSPPCSRRCHCRRGPGAVGFTSPARARRLACAHRANFFFFLPGRRRRHSSATLSPNLTSQDFGCETIDLKKKRHPAEQIVHIGGFPEVDCSVDCVGL